MEQQRHVPGRRSRAARSRAQGIYKPLRGERPLWDFEPGLHRREVAAYHLSEAMGLDLVPPTVLRDGPYGEGSVQWFVDVDHRQHYFTIHEERPDLHDTLRAVALFDLLANNTDRKSGHVLIDGDDHIWGIDHGLCFAADFKLRTVVWEFGGEPIDEALIDAIQPIVEASSAGDRHAARRRRGRRAAGAGSVGRGQPGVPGRSIGPPLSVADRVSRACDDARRSTI